jgi:diacylglycerol kinase (ATP)
MHNNPYKGKTGWKRLWSALGYALHGLRAAYKYEDAFRMELLVATFSIPLALWLPVGNIGKALMVGSILLVLLVELINTAIEATVDRISLENHVLSKRAKDIGSAAVLMSIITSATIWVLVLLDHF